MRRPGLDVRHASIELVPPDVPAALAAVPADRRAVLVPLLLASGYHDRVDLPAAIRATRPGTAHAAVLGPDPLLAVALADRLAAAGWCAGEAVVLAAAGSSDPDAVGSVYRQAGLLAAELTYRSDPPAGPDSLPYPDGAGGTVSGSPRPAPAEPPVQVAVGFGSAAKPDVRAAVAALRTAGARRVAIAPYLLAPGHFADRLAHAGADRVAAPLGAHPAVVELILRRADTAPAPRR